MFFAPVASLSCMILACFRSALFVVVTIPAIFGLRGLRIGSDGARKIQALALI